MQRAKVIHSLKEGKIQLAVCLKENKQLTEYFRDRKKLEKVRRIFEGLATGNVPRNSYGKYKGPDKCATDIRYFRLGSSSNNTRIYTIEQEGENGERVIVMALFKLHKKTLGKKLKNEIENKLCGTVYTIET